jgi:hypothetical protein
VRTVARIVATSAWLAYRTNPLVCAGRDTIMAAGPPALARAQMDLLAGWDPPAALRPSR